MHFSLRQESLVKDELRAHFLLVIRDLFAQRRKTVKTICWGGKIGALLGKEGVASLLAESNVDPSLRQKRSLGPSFSLLVRLSPAIKPRKAPIP